MKAFVNPDDMNSEFKMDEYHHLADPFLFLQPPHARARVQQRVKITPTLSLPHRGGGRGAVSYKHSTIAGSS